MLIFFYAYIFSPLKEPSACLLNGAYRRLPHVKC